MVINAPIQNRREPLHPYELRFLFEGEVIWTTQEMFANDLDALEETAKLAVAHDVQIWQGVRLVVHIKKGDQPLAATDPVRA